MHTFGEATDAFVIAEGVETEAEAAVLRDCGITLMQGYYYARPSEEPDLAA
jgi:EAL domain-containing protein (putative c-di-GMP-specific phosphodiesterase class I)